MCVCVCVCVFVVVVGGGGGGGGATFFLTLPTSVVFFPRCKQIPRLEALLEGHRRELEAALKESKINIASAEASRRAAAASDAVARESSEALHIVEVRMEALRAEAEHARELHSATLEELKRRLGAAEVLVESFLGFVVFVLAVSIALGAPILPCSPSLTTFLPNLLT